MLAFHLQILVPDCRPVSKVITLFKVVDNFCVAGWCHCAALFVGEEYSPLRCGEEPQYYHCAGAKQRHEEYSPANWVVEQCRWKEACH